MQQQQQPCHPISKIRGTNAQPGPSQRQQIDPPQHGSNNTDDDGTDYATLARLYKAEAYEAKFRFASQDQRVRELQAELKEIRFIQNMQCESSGTTDAGAEGRERGDFIKDDAELIEALAVELETMEKDMHAAQARVAELEKVVLEMKVKLQEASMMCPSPNQREAELKKQLELKQQEVDNATNDAKEGLTIVKDLHGALRLARSERDEARSNLFTLRSSMEQRMGGTADDQTPMVRELESALKSMRHERDEALLELSSLFEEVNSLRECSSICEMLEQSNTRLQTELEILQSQLGPERKDLHEVLVVMRTREERMKQEYNKLLEESKQMETALEEIVIKFEEQRTELSMQTAALKELQDLHVTNIADINKDHTNELEQMRLSHEDAIKRLESRFAQEPRTQSDLINSHELEWEEKTRFLQEELTNSETRNKEYEAIKLKDRIEIENLQNALKEMKKVANNMDTERPHDELVVENANLNTELQRRIEAHKHMTLELESKSLELTRLQSLLVQYSIVSDGETIKMIPKAELVVQTETASTQDDTEAEATVSSLRDESSIHSDQTSRIEQLEDALRDMQVALVAVSSRKISLPRKEIEDDALREYCAQRLLVQK